jgi:hypothetical protein
MERKRRRKKGEITTGIQLKQLNFTFVSMLCHRISEIKMKESGLEWFL